ncbi:hypothetical protein V6N11_080220 [Hibiscus sabdariffa]|uniref:Uncharacterized protein n=1 Tax=Hibiscus sabdariffa TaxID=183260 RepID=A0ABR1ZR64_9ROSI
MVSKWAFILSWWFGSVSRSLHREANVQLKLATSKGVVFYLSVDETTVMMMLSCVVSICCYQIEMANILEKLGMSRGNDIGSTRIELKGEGDRYHKYHGNILDFHMHLKLNNRQRQNIPTSLGSLMATQKSLRGLGSDA